ncbi:NAM-like protein [Panicum miliaceum]|uniref:NAM-like protein n=1 Tax=Panicum miliaceum TaxID=4540 RepID=A0A3L6PEU5_PANMI|nr:NAM-like protein [Panicum miliaceum]
MNSSPRMSTAINVDSSHNAVPDNAPPETDQRKRPMGKKKAKEALRRGGGEACVEALDHLWKKKRV